MFVNKKRVSPKMLILKMTKNRPNFVVEKIFQKLQHNPICVSENGPRYFLLISNMIHIDVLLKSLIMTRFLKNILDLYFVKNKLEFTIVYHKFHNLFVFHILVILEESTFFAKNNTKLFLK